MPGQRPILAMSFVASLGLTLEVLACTLPREQAPNFWPLLVVLFYIFLPIPIMISRSVKETISLGLNDGVIKKTRDQALFLTAGIMVSSFALPILMARTPLDKPLIAPISCFLVMIGNHLCYATMGMFCIYFKPLAGI